MNLPKNLQRSLLAVLLLGLVVVPPIVLTKKKQKPEATPKVTQKQRLSSGENDTIRKFEQLDPQVKTVLRWLPAETETLVYLSTGIAANAAKNAKVIPESTGILDFIRKGKFSESVEACKVRFEIVGSCRFRAPKGWNRFYYAGCHVIVFDIDLKEDSRKELFSRFAADADSIVEVNGYKVAKFEETSGLDQETYFVCLPKPNVLLVGMDEQYFATVLDRMRASPESSVLQFDSELWEQLDVKSPQWSMRLALRRWENDDGFVAFFSGTELIIRNLLVDPNNSLYAIRERWTLLPPLESNLKLKLISPHVAEIRLSVQDEDFEALYILIFWRLGYRARL